MMQTEHLIGIDSAIRARSALLLDLEKTLREMAMRTERLLSELPRSTAVFHNVNDAMTAYRMLCPYLLFLEEGRQSVNEAVLALATLRERSAARFAALSIQAADQNGEQAEGERQALLQFVAQADVLAEAMGRFVRMGLRPYLQALDEASDGEHDGKSCNVMKIGAHGRAFCDRIAELLSVMEEQKNRK